MTDLIEAAVASTTHQNTARLRNDRNICSNHIDGGANTIGLVGIVAAAMPDHDVRVGRTSTGETDQ